MDDIERLKILCDLTLELTKLKHSTCNHLAVENCAPEILSNLLQVFAPPLYLADTEIDLKKVEEFWKNRNFS